MWGGGGNRVVAETKKKEGKKKKEKQTIREQGGWWLYIRSPSWDIWGRILVLSLSVKNRSQVFIYLFAEQTTDSNLMRMWGEIETPLATLSLKNHISKKNKNKKNP